MSQENIMTYETVALDDAHSALVIINQTKLPNEREMLHLQKQEDIWQAIYQLQVRGAPAIGVAAAIGIYLAAKEIVTEERAEFVAQFQKAKDYLATARPTAVNLFWALDRMAQVVADHPTDDVAALKGRLHDEAVAIKMEDTWVCKMIGEYGLTLLHDGDGILTHCNAGQLAASKYGTALAPIHLGHERGMRFHVFTDETRPLLQGARLSAYELCSAGIDTTLICDNMASVVLKNGWVQAILVGCDRVAANGDVANKIGTAGVAILAHYYGVPFYVCAPLSTIDWQCPTGEAIKIEQRPAREVTEMWYQARMAPEDVQVFNPAFDVTEAALVSAIITEYGIARAPYEESLAAMAQRRQAGKNAEGGQ